MNRTLNVMRMQLVNKWTYIYSPLLVLGAALLISIAVYAIIYNAGVRTPMYGGGAQAPLWYFGVVGVQALTLTFPFSQAMSVTRREYYLGTLGLAAITAAGLAVVFVIGGFIEQATGGWGVNGYFFSLDWIWEGGPLAAGVVYFAIAMLFFVVGFWAATIYKRFGTVVVTVVTIGVAVVLVGIAALITVTGTWPAVVDGILALGALGLALCGLIVLAVLAASSFVTLRRAIP
jgi:hypothetical protein